MNSSNKPGQFTKGLKGSLHSHKWFLNMHKELPYSKSMTNFSRKGFHGLFKRRGLR